MAYYQIKLTPVDNFFFGGENHNNEEVANYFIESNYYPQQTTLLGFTRYLLLLKHNLIGSGNIKTEGEPFIGVESFDYDNPVLTFGKIKSLSSLYFLKNNNIFIIAPLDLAYDLGEFNGNFFLKKNNKKYSAKMGRPVMRVTDLKGGNCTDLYNEKHGSSVVFPIAHTGNEKAEKGESRDESFYKQTFLRMNPGWSFAIQAEVDDDLSDETLFLPFGGERSMFKVEIEKQKTKVNLVPDLEIYVREKPGLYLLCDCFAESMVMECTCFAVNQVVSFRNFRSSIKTKNYAAFGKNSNGLKRSMRYNLLTRGSVLYFAGDNERKAAIELLNKEHCINIGFNNWKLIN